jgi:hypothetical protein
MTESTDNPFAHLIRFRNECAAEPHTVVADLEKVIGVRFPESLKRLWAVEDELGIACKGSFAEPSGFGLYAVREGHFEYVSDTILERFEAMAEEFPRVVPIGNEGNGDQLCLDYRFRDEPVVLKYDHEIGYRTPNPFYFLARSFDEYVDRSLPARQEHYKTTDATVTPDDLTEFLGISSEETFKYIDRKRQLAATKPAT